MATSRSRCFTVARFIKPPIKYTFFESLIIADSDYNTKEIKPFPKIAIIFQKYVVSQIEFVSGQNLTGESEPHRFVFFHTLN